MQLKTEFVTMPKGRQANMTPRIPSAYPLLCCLGLAWGLVGCQTSAPNGTAPTGQDKVAQIATTPLSDLNVVKVEIPVVLQDAVRAPYAIQAALSCEGLAAEINALNEALGPDLDVPHSPQNPSALERGVGAVGNAATGAVKGAVEGAIPFRGWLRKLSGAERQSAKVAAAIAAGAVRRGFLKGQGQVLGCKPPAAPL